MYSCALLRFPQKAGALKDKIMQIIVVVAPGFTLVGCWLE
jgi:hypothetical protein